MFSASVYKMLKTNQFHTANTRAARKTYIQNPAKNLR